MPVPTIERYESEEGRRSKVTGGWWNIRCKAGRRCPGFKDWVSREPMPKGPQGPAKGGRRMLPRKASQTRTIVDRTAIRHRWARRAASGARVIHGKIGRESGREGE